MSNCYSGKDGALAVALDPDAETPTYANVAMLTSWTVTQNAEVLECAYMGSTWKDHKTGLLSWEGSAEANFTDSSASGDNANAKCTVGDKVALKFYPNHADTDVSFSGEAIVTSVENSAAIGDVQTVSISFTGTGPLTTDLTT